MIEVIKECKSLMHSSLSQMVEALLNLFARQFDSNL